MGLLNYLISAVYDFLDGSGTELNNMQVFALKSISIDDLVLYADKRSLENNEDPSCMYAYFQGNHIGTAYGKCFSFDEDLVEERPEVREVVRKIMQAYLPYADR